MDSDMVMTLRIMGTLTIAVWVLYLIFSSDKPNE